MSKVELVWSTPNGDQLISKMARVSNPKNENNTETAPRLISYLIRNQHWSPFEMASMCVRIETERDISAQILRHKSFSFQEFSTRYAGVDRCPATPELRRQDTKNRQNSFPDLDPDLADELSDKMAVQIGAVWNLYREMLGLGVAKETARRILPLCTPTTLYMCGTVRSWIHYLDLRTDGATQLEHREVALAVRDIFESEYPMTSAAIELLQ